MFEVIWSVSSDSYIVRKVCTFSNIVPQIIGTEDECNQWIAKNK